MTADATSLRLPTRRLGVLTVLGGALLAALAPRGSSQEQLDIYAGLAAGGLLVIRARNRVKTRQDRRVRIRTSMS